MRVLVTGANGFVGRALVPALTAAGFTVRAAARHPPSPPFSAEVETVTASDLASEGNLSALAASCDAIVHLAGIAHTGPGIADAVYERINHLGTMHLAHAAEAAGAAHFVFVSSVRAQSGPTADRVLTENDTPHPSDAYGRSKLAAEQSLRAMKLPHTILRPVLIYGPDVKGNLATLAKLAALPVPLPLAGLTRQRSLLGIDGLIGAIVLALRNPATIGQTYLVADPAPLSVAEIVTALRRGLGRKPDLFRVSPRLMRAALGVIGKKDTLDRLDGEMIADPRKLIDAGWQPIRDTPAALAAVAQQMIRSR